VVLLGAYVCDPAGGGEPLPGAVKSQWPNALRQRAQPFRSA
jgi:hypothetical protein